MKTYEKYLTAYAQRLRKEMTPQEKKLWYQYLHNYPLRFRRQVPADKYVLDFYCAQAKLAVEIDGTRHYEPELVEADAVRSRALGRLGIEVVRFDNIQIDRQFAIVCEEIDRIVKERVELLRQGKGRGRK